jgi:D-serine deaminase-like pyridoxal phosphate-dependent protein
LRANDADAAFATSLFLHGTVISKNVPSRVTIDAGLKSFATDEPLPRVSDGAPETGFGIFKILLEGLKGLNPCT